MTFKTRFQVSCPHLCLSSSLWNRHELIIGHIITLPSLGNLPVERAKDAVCFLQRGGVSLSSSAIVYNIVEVKVTC